jgi:hypothetical protein
MPNWAVQLIIAVIVIVGIIICINILADNGAFDMIVRPEG